MRSYWDSSTQGPGSSSGEKDDSALQRARKVLESRPAGGQYHDPPLFLLTEVERMPPDVQAWVRSLGDDERWIAEFQLNLVGVQSFVKHLEYQRDYAEHMSNF